MLDMREHRCDAKEGPGRVPDGPAETNQGATAFRSRAWLANMELQVGLRTQRLECPTACGRFLRSPTDAREEISGASDPAGASRDAFR